MGPAIVSNATRHTNVDPNVVIGSGWLDHVVHDCSRGWSLCNFQRIPG